jgi:hypothetical protein
VTKAGWPPAPPPAGAVLADAALLCGTVDGAAATPAQAAAPVTRKHAAATLAQTRPNRPTSRITRHASGTSTPGVGFRQDSLSTPPRRARPALTAGLLVFLDGRIAKFKLGRTIDYVAVAARPQRQALQAAAPRPLLGRAR